MSDLQFETLPDLFLHFGSMLKTNDDLRKADIAKIDYLYIEKSITYGEAWQYLWGFHVPERAGKIFDVNDHYRRKRTEIIRQAKAARIGMAGNLFLPLKREYFEAIQRGEKAREYRRQTKYWKKRLEGRSYQNVVFTLGYPARHDLDRHIVRLYNGYEEQEITHKEFGSDPVQVYAIKVSSW